MNNSAGTHSSSTTKWKLLGELELTAGETLENRIQSWVAEQLASLSLSTGFLDRVAQSAYGSAMRYLHSDAELALGHIHLSIHVPKRMPTKGKTWGVFHVERIQNKASPAGASDHTIEFYLYLEGD